MNLFYASLLFDLYICRFSVNMYVHSGLIIIIITNSIIVFKASHDTKSLNTVRNFTSVEQKASRTVIYRSERPRAWSLLAVSHYFFHSFQTKTDLLQTGWEWNKVFSPRRTTRRSHCRSSSWEKSFQRQENDSRDESQYTSNGHEPFGQIQQNLCYLEKL